MGGDNNVSHPPAKERKTPAYHYRYRHCKTTIVRGLRVFPSYHAQRLLPHVTPHIKRNPVFLFKSTSSATHSSLSFSDLNALKA